MHTDVCTEHNPLQKLMTALASTHSISLLSEQDPKASTDHASTQLRTNNDSALYWAVRCGRDDILKDLLDTPDFDGQLGKYKDADKNTELHWAARLASAPMLSLLLGRCKDPTYIHTQNKARETALYDAIRAESTDAVQLLLRSGANVALSNNAEYSPLHLAAKRNVPEITKLICPQSNLAALTGKDGLTALHLAIRENGHIDNVKLLLGAGAESNVISHDGERPLHSAALKGRWEIMDLLWRAGAPTDTITKNGYSIMHCAVHGGHFKAIEMILTWTQAPPGCMPISSEILALRANGLTALHLAVSSKHGKEGDSSKVVGHLLGKLEEKVIKAKTKTRETIMHLAARNGRDDLLDVFTKLRSITKMLDWQDADGATALHRAIEHNSSSMMLGSLLNWMDNRAICFQNDNGETALHLAARGGQGSLVKKLLQKMSHDAVALCNKDGETALHVAAGIGDSETTALLLAQMSQKKIALVNDKGESAFAKAALGPNPNHRLIELLVKYEADVSEEYETMWTPLDQDTRKSISDILRKGLNEISWADRVNWQMIVRWAARNGDLEIIQTILGTVPEESVDEIEKDEEEHTNRRGSKATEDEQTPSRPKKTALFWAALGGRQDIIDLLLQHPILRKYYQESPKVKERCLDAALTAARHGHFSVVATLIQHIQKSNGAARSDWKPLDWAVDLGDAEIVRLMLIKGAEAILPTKHPITSPEIRTLLTERGPTPKWYSKESPQRLWSNRPQLCLDPFKTVCRRFKANILDFYHCDDSVFPLEMSDHSVYDLIYDPELGPNKIMDHAYKRVRDHPALCKDYHFRWIHLPANNVSQQSLTAHMALC